MEKHRSIKLPNGVIREMQLLYNPILMPLGLKLDISKLQAPSDESLIQEGEKTWFWWPTDNEDIIISVVYRKYNDGHYDYFTALSLEIDDEVEDLGSVSVEYNKEGVIVDTYSYESFEVEQLINKYTAQKQIGSELKGLVDL